MKKLFLLILAATLAGSAHSQLLDSFKLDIIKSIGVKYTNGYFTGNLVGPVFGKNRADTASKVPGTIKTIKGELWIADELGHWVKAVTIDTLTKIATKVDLASRATKTELAAATDTITKIATKKDLTTVTPDTIGKIATKYDLQVANGGVVLDTSVFNRRSMNLADVPDKAAARANLGIVQGGGNSDTAKNIPIRTTKPPGSDNIWLSSIDYRLHYRLFGWEYILRGGSIDSIADYTPQNLFKASQQQETGFYDYANVTITANNVVAPDGSTTAETLDWTQQYQPFPQAISGLVPGRTYTFSCYYKKGTITTIYGLAVTDLLHGNTPVVAAHDIGPETNTSSWTRLSVTFVCPPNMTVAYCYLFQTGDQIGTFYAWGAQLNEGPLRPYTPTVDDIIVP